MKSTSSCALLILGVAAVASAVLLAVAFVVVGAKLNAKMRDLKDTQAGLIDRIVDLEEENDYLFEGAVSNKVSRSVIIRF